ncbi:MAG: shikimate kinase AroK [Gammaproteobacteria bacterium]|nr:shikimate kinase AroK [Gammaproteobacteria bacterium]
MSDQNIFLVGLMAVGKSTVGRLLAEALHRPFYDSDDEIEARAGAEIGWIFDVEGELGFREREEQLIDELSKMSGIVVATGGGAVKRANNRARLASRGTVIHLDCSMRRLLARTRNDRTRPLLQGHNRKEILDNLMAERAPLYAEIADYRVVSDGQGAKNLVQHLVKTLRNDGII